MGELIQNGKPLPERICLRAPLWQVLAMIPCFAAIVGGHLFGAYAAFSNLDGSFPHPVAFGLYISAQGFFFLLVGVFFFLAAGRERIWIFDDAIVQRGIFFTRRIEFADIVSLNWRRHTFRLVIEGPDTRIAIWLNTYPIAQQQQVIEFFRSAVPKHLHKNYRAFRSRYTEFLKHHVTLPRPAPRFRWLALVDAFLYLLVPGLCILLWTTISRELPGVSLFGPTELVDERQKLLQVFGFFAGVCAICFVLAGVYVYRYFAFRETAVVSK